MAVHQRINRQNYDVANLFLPHNSVGRLNMLVSDGTTINFHRPRGSRLSMLINGKQRVNL